MAHRLLTLWILLFFVFSSRGIFGKEKDLPQFVREAPAHVQYPEDDAIVLQEKISYILLPDGRVRKHFFRARKLFTDYAVTRTTDPRVSFNTARQELKILQCRTFQKDGSIVDTPRNGFNLTTPSALAGAPDYCDIQEMVITHVGVERGATTLLEYEIVDKKPPPFLCFEEVFGGEEPCLLKEVQVSLPWGESFSSFLENGEPVTHVRGKRGKETSLSWACGELPSAPLTTEAVAPERILPVLSFSTCKDIQQMHEALSLESRLDPSDSLIKKSKEITQGRETERDKLKALTDFVATSIATIDWNLRDFLFHPRKASRVLETSYGHSLDKSALLAALLNASGLKPCVGLAGREIGNHSEKCLFPNACKTGITGIEEGKEGDEKMIWVDPTAKLSAGTFSTGSTWHGMEVLHSQSREGKIRSPRVHKKALEGACHFAGTVEIHEKGKKLGGEGSLSLSGGLNPYFDPKAMKADTLLGGMLAGAESISSYPKHLGLSRSAFDLKWEGRSEVQEGRLAMALPNPKMVLDDIPLHLQKRKLPLFLSSKISWKAQLEIRFDEDEFRVEYFPRKISFSNESAGYVARGECSKGRITVERELFFLKKTIPPEAYPSLRKALATILSEGANTVVFVKK